jgi:hypothetical protein
MSEIVNELCELDERVEDKSLRRTRTARRCRIPIGPLASNGDAAPCRLAKDQRLGRTDTPGFEDGKALPSKRVKGMAHLSPSQRLVGNLGSSR